MTKKLANRTVLIVALVTGLLLPTFAGAAVFCQREITGVRLSDLGRVQIRSVDQVSGSNNILMTICNVKAPMGTIDPDVCQDLYAQLLAAFHTDSPISVQLRTATLDANGLWGGTCDSLTHQGDFSSAITTIENQK